MTMWSSVTVDRAHSLHCNNQKWTTRKATPCWPAPYWIPKVSPAAPAPICNHSSVIELADRLLGPTPHGKTETRRLRVSTFHILADPCGSRLTAGSGMNFVLSFLLMRFDGWCFSHIDGIYAFRNITTTTNQNTDTFFYHLNIIIFFVQHNFGAMKIVHKKYVVKPS